MRRCWLSGGGKGVWIGVHWWNENWSHSGYILKVELTRCAGGLGEGSE